MAYSNREDLLLYVTPRAQLPVFLLFETKLDEIM